MMKNFLKMFVTMSNFKLNEINSWKRLCITENVKIIDELILVAHNVKLGTSEVQSLKFLNVTKG